MKSKFNLNESDLHFYLYDKALYTTKIDNSLK